MYFFICLEITEVPPLPKAVAGTKVEATYGVPSTTEAPPSPKVVTETKVEATHGAPSTTEAPP